jgi:hypothetical protein
MTTRVSKRNGQEYQTYSCRRTVEGDLVLREFKHLAQNRVIARFNVPSASRPNLVNVVTQRVTGPEDGHSSVEMEVASWSCGCEQYFFAWQKEGYQACCKHIEQVTAQLRQERATATRARLERVYAARAQEGDMAAVNALAALEDLFQSDEITAWAR